MKANPSEAVPIAHNGAPGKSKLEIISSLPSKLQQRARENPLAALVAVGTVGFALGNLVGSRLGRLALAVSVPIVVNRLLDGTLSRDLMRWVTGIPDAPPT
jgi:hypothetical protein